MPIRVKPDITQTLCNTCARVSRIKNANNETLIFCHAIDKRVNAVITECDSYTLKGTMRLHEMQEIGWILDLNPKQIGFVKPGSAAHRRLKDEDLEIS